MDKQTICHLPFTHSLTCCSRFKWLFVNVSISRMKKPPKPIPCSRMKTTKIAAMINHFWNNEQKQNQHRKKTHSPGRKEFFCGNIYISLSNAITSVCTFEREKMCFPCFGCRWRLLLSPNEIVHAIQLLPISALSVCLFFSYLIHSVSFISISCWRVWVKVVTHMKIKRQIETGCLFTHNILMALFSHPIPLYAQRCIYYVQWIKNFYFLFGESKK